MKLAFLYPGQGSQKVGMGEALRCEDPALYDRYFDVAEQASGLPLRQLCEDGPIERLTRTEVSQPALFTLSLALTEVARQEGIEPSLVAGHSLGELSAAVAAGALSFEDGLRLVVVRSRSMAERQAKRPGTMAAVLGLDADVVAELCGQAGGAVIANHNSARQLVVSGDRAAVGELCRLVEQAGGRPVPLPVGGAFHSPAMVPVRDALQRCATELRWQRPAVGLASNVHGSVLHDPEAIRDAIVAQVAAPVRWSQCMAALLDEGVTHVLELGPGRVLTGLARAARRDLQTVAADSRAALRRCDVSHVSAPAPIALSTR
jgi:[acyl-carrier-protein] S-malonyltransferase